ncbi:hypothetical protein H7F51_06885 [Novosphingobium flavum]|uniref:Lipoprotein n=1 Tax=Novosphingobium flavum TaxID=1778672 RepID=A0A7X1FQU5_9SPHN|nr:hypothetical protein [Novosphingobium flavum]MBC2665238.1 hypothetical protein [Novosphingobium flavum]
MMLRILCSIVAALSVGGCSYVYDVVAVIVDGRLAFIVDPKSQSGADCIRSIHVSTGESARATPVPSDDRQLVANGAFWWKDTAVDECLNPFPVFYGAPLKGKPFVYKDGLHGGVEPKPLLTGVIYDVDMSGSGSGYGGGRFRILPNNRVENIPKD